tara:strand:+ start:6875 stop:7048 length:174 start_codon:yes stop_codon:yes gene_type:complete
MVVQQNKLSLMAKNTDILSVFLFLLDGRYRVIVAIDIFLSLNKEYPIKSRLSKVVLA